MSARRLPLSGPTREEAMARVRAITSDLRVIRDPWIRRRLVRERRELHEQLGWVPPHKTR